MSQTTSPSMRGSKKHMESIAVFDYYISSLFPRLFGIDKSSPMLNFRRSLSHQNLRYSYVRGISSFEGQISLQNCLKALWQMFSHNQGKENLVGNAIQKSTNVKGSLFRSQEMVHQKIDIFTRTKQESDQKMRKRSGFLSPHKAEQRIDQPRKRSFNAKTRYSVRSMASKGSEVDEYSVYVIHRAMEGHSWEHFIERFELTNTEGKCEIEYSAAFSVQQVGFFSFSNSHKVLEEFFNNCVFNGIDQTPRNLELFKKRLQMMFMESHRKKVEADVEASMSQEHIRKIQFNEEQKRVHDILMPRAEALFAKLNQERQPKPYFLENLVCRLMENNSFSEKKTWQALEYYLNFEQRIRKQYKWEDFQVYHDMHIFSYIGKDKLGRPVLLNRLRNVLCSKIKDYDHFFDYHFYLFEIYLQDQMHGWVDQFSIITDTSNQVADNTNLGFSKRIMTEAMKLCMGRHYKVVAFDVGFLGMALNAVAKNILPVSFTGVIKMVGTDRKELMKELLEFMDVGTIPEFIGGLNPTIQSEKGSQKDCKLTDTTSDR